MQFCLLEEDDSHSSPSAFIASPGIMAGSVGHTGLMLPPMPIPKLVNWLLEGLYSPSKPLHPLYFDTLSLQYLAVCKGILALASKEQSFCSWLVRFPQSEMPHGDWLAGSSCE